MPDGVTEVYATNFEILRVLEGKTVTFESTTGERVLFRLFTAEELLAQQNAVAEIEGGPVERMAVATAQALTSPIRVGPGRLPVPVMRPSGDPLGRAMCSCGHRFASHSPEYHRGGNVEAGGCLFCDCQVTPEV